MALVQIATSITLDQADAYRMIEALESAGDEEATSAAALIDAAIETRPYADPIWFSAAERKALLRAIDKVLEGQVSEILTIERLRRTLLDADA